MKNQMKTLFLLMAILSTMHCSNNPKPLDTAVSPAATKKTIILAVDGGGIKGIIPAVFLNAIEIGTLKLSYQLFDIIGGTSTGGIISVAVTSMTQKTNRFPYTGKELMNIYGTQGGQIFVAQGCQVDFCATYYARNVNQGIEPYLQSLLPAGFSLKDAKAYIGSLPGRRVQHMFTTSYGQFYRRCRTQSRPKKRLWALFIQLV